MSARPLRVARRIRIARPPDEVFALVAEPANDPRWCAKVRSVEQVLGAGPGPGARYLVVHAPVPLRPPRPMDHRCVGWEPPHRITWREDDGTDVIEVTYELEPTDGGGVQLTQRDEATLGAPRLLQPIMKRGIGTDVQRQLRALKRLLESER
jgi:uncharacterized protein YndB with AHSA1/START domain